MKVDGELREWVDIQSVVNQGWVISPDLFSLYSEVFDEVSEMEGKKVGGKNINNIRYANDTALVAESEVALQQIVYRAK